MAQKDQEYFKQLAHQLMFDVDETEIAQLQEEFETLDKQIALLERIDTDGVEPMVYPFETETTFLRADEVAQTLSREDALSNAQSVMAGHVHVPKVVK